MTDRFVNGNQSNDPQKSRSAQGADWMGGDLSGVTNMIESGYFSDLGVNALWLTHLTRQQMEQDLQPMAFMKFQHIMDTGL